MPKHPNLRRSGPMLHKPNRYTGRETSQPEPNLVQVTSPGNFLRPHVASFEVTLSVLVARTRAPYALGKAGLWITTVTWSGRRWLWRSRAVVEGIEHQPAVVYDNQRLA